jgi:hypothetical protein
MSGMENYKYGPVAKESNQAGGNTRGLRYLKGT